MAVANDELLVDQLRSVWCDPPTFARLVLRSNLWSLQQQILRSVATKPRIAVKACHSSGKTYVAAAAVLWWITAFEDGIAVTTAPTWKQVEKILWGEIHRAVFNATVAYPPLNRTELRIGPGNFALGLSTNQGVNFQGWHGAKLLIVLDEAPGVEPEIWEAIEGVRAGGDVHVLAIGNPVVIGGPFYDAFTEHRENWETYTISAFDTPNFQGLTLEQLLDLPDDELDNNVSPYLTRRRWVREKWHEWGPNHPLWQSRVMGNFPDQAENALFPITWLEAAAETQVVPKDRPRTAKFIEAGVDVAGAGEDETVVVLRDEEQVLALEATAQSDPRGWVVEVLNRYKDKLRAVKVDSIGIGYNFALHLKDAGFPVELVNVAEAADDKERFHKRKDELYWGLRDRLAAGQVKCLSDKRTIAQMATILWEVNPRGQIVVESKEDMAARGVKSPDRAEAMMLAFAKPRQVSSINMPTLTRVSPYVGRI